MIKSNTFTNKNAIINYLVWVFSLLPVYIVKYNIFRVRGPEEEIPAGLPEDIPETMQTYVVIEGFLYLIIGLIMTFVIQFSLEKWVKSEYSLWKKILLVGVIFILGLIFYNVTMFPICGAIQESLMDTSGTSGAILPTTILNIAILVTWYLVYELVRMYDKNKRVKLERAQLESSLKESKLNTLRGQINPHFMFNSLNNIRGLMLEDVGKSREMLTSLSEMLRFSLTKNAGNAVPLREEMDMIENFVNLSKIQFEDRLTYKEEIDEELLDFSIPPMIVQLLVENALKHGINKLKDGGEVHVLIKKEEEHCCITVINSGILTMDENSTKLGLENIQQRLSLIYGPKASFSLTEKDSKVIAQIKIPL